ncbi:sestrin-1-like [Actinia tenebrosa]|uniref:Sestrin-1-like n=1 Tax=Actinia tenebrosa TaxID=6105 RepID=A0A6P8IKG2_ACTTE|nr:sestrin-1-like [Actinia tenebrosa]
MSDDEDLLAEDESLRDFSVLRTRDSAIRRRYLDSLGKIINLWTSKSEGNGEKDDKKSLMEILPSVLMLSLRCPFPDVREKCANMVENVKLKGFLVPRPLFKGPSCFIPSKEVPPINTDDEQTHTLLVEAFLALGRVPSVTAIMAIHPQYLDWFSRTEFYLMRGEGPLPFDWRHYIAIMAASRHQCCYLGHIYELEFLKYNGDKEWLKGLEHVPRKLQRLSEINKYLAHQPWLIDPSQMEKLLKGQDNWSLSELVQAIVILAHFHSLSSFVFGCGVVSEIDFEAGHTFRPPSLNEANQPSFDSATLNTNANIKSSMTGDELMERMKQVLAEQDVGMEASQEELFQHFEKLESGELAQSTAEVRTSQDSPLSDLARYLNDPKFHYKDFASREERESISTFRIGDCSWEEHGFSLINRLYPDIGTILDEKFNITLGLTYFTLGDKTNVDTTVFRLATWNYIHLVFGIYHDDYLYTEVNKLMEKSYKRYIKMVATCPEKVTQMDYMEFMPQLTHSERVHINLLLLEARMQAELLYAVGAILKYMK